MLDPGEVIVIDDSDEETMMRPPKAKRHRRGSSPLHLHQFGRQSQPININDFDSEVGLEELREAIDVGLHYVQEAGVAAGVDAVAQEEVEAPVMVTNATIITADEAAQALPQLINILPHLDPEYGLKLLREKILCEGQSHTIEHCLQSAVDQLLANVTYPKVQRFLKRKRLDTDSDDEDGEQVSGPQSTRFRNAAMNHLAASDPTCRIFQSGKSAYKTKTFLADERKGKAYIEKALIDLDNLFPLMKTEQ
ncbi:hypothetical protein QFC19_008474 [Naganishia cerealis]|uniref:Uncharacterized protein n=1 Tax=Naganishia cerealis TaxID=610337 RepID=A0ACC2V3B2_9TREE|nr:hypothetical protein QFC19_008474 [Naganishia cerealis]